MKALDIIALHIDDRAILSFEREKTVGIEPWRTKERTQDVVPNQFFRLVAPRPMVISEKQQRFLLQCTTGSYWYVSPSNNRLMLTESLAEARLFEFEIYAETPVTQVQIKDTRGWILKTSEQQNELEFGEPELVKGLPPELVMDLQLQRNRYGDTSANVVNFKAAAAAAAAAAKDPNRAINGSGLPVEPTPARMKVFFVLVLGLPIFVILALYVANLDWSLRIRPTQTVAAAAAAAAAEQATVAAATAAKQRVAGSGLERESEHGFL